MLMRCVRRSLSEYRRAGDQRKRQRSIVVACKVAHDIVESEELAVHDEVYAMGKMQ